MDWVTVVTVLRIRLYLLGLLIEIVLFLWGFVFPLFASLGIFKGIRQSVRCPYFMFFAVTIILKGVPGLLACIPSCFLMAHHFIIDHIEYVALRREQYCLQVKTKGQGQERQYFINTYGDVPPLNFYLLSCFLVFFFLILQGPEMSICGLIYIFFPVKFYNIKLLPWMNQSCHTVFDIVETRDCMHIFEMLLNEMFWCLLPSLRRVVRV